MNNNVTQISYIIILTCAVFFSTVFTDSDVNKRKTLKYSSYIVNETIPNRMNSFIYQTAYKYLCRFNKINNPDLLVYGTKSWTFPKQSVNLTISYPTQSMIDIMKDDHEYIITGFSVVLFADTRESKGYIISGGILTQSISLSFECSDATSIRYQFWLYGVPFDAPRLLEHMPAGSPQILGDDMCY